MSPETRTRSCPATDKWLGRTAEPLLHVPLLSSGRQCLTCLLVWFGNSQPIIHSELHLISQLGINLCIYTYVRPLPNAQSISSQSNEPRRTRSTPFFYGCSERVSSSAKCRGRIHWTTACSTHHSLAVIMAIVKMWCRWRRTSTNGSAPIIIIVSITASSFVSICHCRETGSCADSSIEHNIARH